MIAFVLYAAACFAGMSAVLFGSAMASRWLDARDGGEIDVMEPAMRKEEGC
jgi:hypothetical protein